MILGVEDSSGQVVGFSGRVYSSTALTNTVAKDL
jgi:hypothetical protein